MLLIVGTVRLPADNMGVARPIMKRMADASRLEEGCIDYGYAEDGFDPGLIHVKEMWTDQSALDRHIGRWRRRNVMAPSGWVPPAEPQLTHGICHSSFKYRSSPSAMQNSAIQRSHSSITIRISSRASIAPMQRCLPWPKAAWAHVLAPVHRAMNELPSESPNIS